MPPKANKAKRANKGLDLRSCTSLPEVPVQFPRASLKLPNKPSKQGAPKKWVEQQFIEKEEVQLPDGVRVMCNVGEPSSSGSSVPSQQGSIQQGGSQQGSSQQGGSQGSASTVLIKRIKECRHCHKKFGGINPTHRKNHLLNPTICPFLQSTAAAEVAANGIVEVATARAQLKSVQAQQAGVHPGKLASSAPRAFQVSMKQSPLSKQ